MAFLRLGVACAVRDDQGRILLSKRDDLNVWNLPSGRLDSGELITDAATREVYEETGIRAKITRIVGLYYYQGWERMNILFEAKYVGGDLQHETLETRENRFFAPHDLPSDNIDQLMLDDILNNIKSCMRVVALPTLELLILKIELGWRWIKNLLAGHIEPRHVEFNIYGGRGENKLRSIHGGTAIWQQLNLTDNYQLHHIRQNKHTNTLIFIFDVDNMIQIGFSSEEESES